MSVGRSALHRDLDPLRNGRQNAQHICALEGVEHLTGEIQQDRPVDVRFSDERSKESGDLDL